MTPDTDAPETSDGTDPTALSFELWIGLAATILVIGFGWTLTSPADAGDEIPTREGLEGAESVDDHEMADELAGLTVDQLRERQRDVARLFESGPRESAESICIDFRDVLAAGEASREVRRVLRQGVSRHSNHVPWRCLTELHLDGELPEESELTREFERFWAEVELVDAHGDIMTAVLQDFLEDDALPETTDFDRWLRRCALAVDYQAAPTCQRVVRRHRPEFGDDLLEVLIDHLGYAPLEADRYFERFGEDLELATDALAYFARYGQPPGWEVDDRDVPDNQTLFRRGAVFQLCRLMNSPDLDIQTRTAEALGDVASVAIRPLDPNMQFRWRQTCRLAFGDPDQPRASVPVLGVALADGDQTRVDYGLDTLVDRDLCEQYDDRPAWYCGARRWTGDDETAPRLLSKYFARTGWVEWYEPDKKFTEIGTGDD